MSFQQVNVVAAYDGDAKFLHLAQVCAGSAPVTTLHTGKVREFIHMKKILLASLIASGLIVSGCSDSDSVSSSTDTGMTDGDTTDGDTTDGDTTDGDTTDGDTTDGSTAPPAATPGVGNSVYDNIFNDPDLSILLAAIDTAGLADTLDDEGSEFTIFAPNNAAFAGFVASNDGFADAAALLAAGADVLTPILTYHVVSGTTDAAAASAAAPADLTTVNGATVALGNSDTAPTGLSIGGTDVLVGNSNYTADTSVGVVHIIASVLVPPAAE